MMYINEYGNLINNTYDKITQTLYFYDDDIYNNDRLNNWLCVIKPYFSYFKNFNLKKIIIQFSDNYKHVINVS